MALARKCDVCGQYYKLYETEDGFNGIALIGRSNGLDVDHIQNTLVYDCCPSCLDNIKQRIKFLGVIVAKEEQKGE